MPDPHKASSTVPLSERIVGEIIAQIEQGRLLAGSKLPSVRQAARERGISAFTISDAYQRLVTRGYLQARRGAGYYVSSNRPEHPAARPVLATLPIDDDWLLSRIYQRDNGMLFAGCGWLPDHWYDREANSSAMRAIARRKEPFHPYGDPLGYAALRAAIAHQLSGQHLPLTAEQIILTQGASKALDMVACTLARPGDTLLIDDPGYCNLISCLRFRGYKLIGVPWNADGPDTERLATLLQAHQPKLFFTNPVLHNPTGASYTLSTAHKVMRLVEAAGCMLVEDNVALPFHPNPLPPLCSLGEPGRHLYIGSFSKALAPGLRVGYVAGGLPAITQLLRYKMVSGLTTPALNEMLALELMQAPGSRRQLQEARDALSQAQQICQQRFDAAGWQLFSRPEHGLFLLARPPQATKANDLAEMAREQQIVLAPGRLFSCENNYQDWWRFNVAYSRNSRLWDFINAI